MSGTVAAPEGITNPPIDELLDRTDSKYSLVIYAAKRARQINAYYSQLGEGLLEYVGPLVETGVQEKPLSIALREINGGLLTHEQVGRGGRDHHQVGLLTDPHVWDLVHVVPHLGGDGLAGQGGPRGRTHELQRSGRRHDGHVVAGLGQSTQQLAGLVRRDAAADPEHDPWPLRPVHRVGLRARCLPG